MIDCCECENRISDQATACPHCGVAIATTGRGIKGHQVLGLIVMILGVVLYLVASDSAWTVIGGMLMVLGLLGALLQ